MQLVKIYDSTCDVCALLRGIDEQVAEENNLFFRKITISECAINPSHIRDYVVAHYLSDDGMIDIPLYLILNNQGSIESSGVVKSIEELQNLINAWKKWESSQK